MVRRQRQSGSRSRTRPAPRRSRKPHDTDAETRVAVLTRELSQALEQQAATSEVLQVISSSPSELEPVFQAMLAHATRLCEANFGVLYRFDGHVFHAVALQNAVPALGDYLRREPPRPDPRNALGRVLRTKQPVHITDITAERAYAEREPARVAAVELAKARTFLAVPMLKENELLGIIAIYRQEVRPFTDKQIALVQNFASQAVIAIENARLFQAEQQRTRELAEIIGAANRHLGRAAHCRELARRVTACIRVHAGERDTHLPSQIWDPVPPRSRWFPRGSDT